MTAKEYFNTIAVYRDSIERLMKHLDYLREGATAIGGFDYSKPQVQSAPKNVTEDKIIKIADAALKVSDLMARYSGMILEAEERLAQLSRYEYSKIISYRFLDTKRHSMGWIAEQLGYDEVYTRRLYGEALDEFEEKFLK